jgi:hypothetical protein
VLNALIRDVDPHKQWQRTTDKLISRNAFSAI